MLLGNDMRRLFKKVKLTKYSGLDVYKKFLFIRRNDVEFYIKIT